MAYYFTLNDGVLDDISIYGTSLSTAEVTNNTLGVWLSTTDLYSPVFTGNGSSISAISINISARKADPNTDTLTLNISSSTNFITETYPVSNFTSTVGYSINNTISPSWQILKLTNPFSLSNGQSARINLKTSSNNTLSLVGSSFNYNKFVIFTPALTIPSLSTSNGNYAVTLSSTSSPFTSLSTISSYYFSGAGDTNNFPRLVSDTNIAYNIQQSKGGTIEGWFYITQRQTNASNPYGNSATLFSLYTGPNQYIGLNVNNIGKLNISQDPGSTFILGTTSSTTIIPLSTWTHFAWVYTGAEHKIFINGNDITSELCSSKINNTDINAYQIHVGAIYYNAGVSPYYAYLSPFLGYINNFRVSRLPRYLNNFTPPTSPFINQTDTKLLLNGSSTTTFLETPLSGFTDIHIGGSLKGSSIETRNITSNNAYLSSLFIHKDSILNFPYDKSTSLKIYGLNGLQITPQGTLNIGTSSNVIPLSVNHIILDTNINVNNNSNLNSYGYPKTISTYLSSTILSSNRTFITTDSLSNNWNINDNLLFIPNTVQKNGYDTLILSSFSNNNTITTTSNSIFTHLGYNTLPYIPSIYNLNKNIIFLNSSINDIILDINSNFNVKDSKFINTCIGNSLFYPYNLQFNNNIISFDNYIESSPQIGYLSYPTLLRTGLNSVTFNPTVVDNINYYGPSSFWTLEFWVYLLDTPPQNGTRDWPTQIIPTVGGPVFQLGIASTRAVKIQWYIGGSGGERACRSTNIIPLSTWSNIVISCSASIYSIYINGIKETLIPDGANAFTNTMDTINGGSFTKQLKIEGTNNYYISNLKLTNTVIYTASSFNLDYKSFSITTSNGLSTNPNNTQLLTFQNSYYKDNSLRNIKTTSNTISAINANTLNLPKFLTNVNTTNCLLSNNIFINSSLNINKLNVNNINLVNNTFILSSNISDGIKIINLSSNNFKMTDNKVINSANNGALLFNNTISGNYDILSYNASNIGILLSGNFSNVINGGGINSTNDGLLLSGNNLNILTPTKIDTNRLICNNNGDSGIEAYNIYGNLSNIIVNENRNYGIKTSIGNGPTIFDGLTSTMSVSGKPISVNIAILSGFNNYETVITNAYLSTLSASTSALTANGSLLMDSVRFADFGLDNSILSSATNLQLLASRNLIEGSFYINNSKVGSLPVGAAGLNNIYQPGNSKNIGFAYTNFNQINGYHITYTNGGQRSIDTTTSVADLDRPSERLTPNNTSVKLRSGSIFIALNASQSTTIAVYVRRDSTYNGNAPRLMLKANPSVGINNDIILATLNTTDEFTLMSGTSPAVTNNGILEFYVDCDGTTGYINIDNWFAT